MTYLTRLLILGGAAIAVALAIFALRSWLSKAKVPQRFDPADAGLPRGVPALIEFVSPFCYECKVVMPVLKAASVVHKATLAIIDAKIRPDLAAKYSIRTTPTVLVVDARGAVRGGWLGTPPHTELEAALVAANGQGRRVAVKRA